MKSSLILVSGFGTVGRAVASDTSDPRFESLHRQKFICQLYNTEKTKIKKKEVKKLWFPRKCDLNQETTGSSMMRAGKVCSELCSSVMKQWGEWGAITARRMIS